MGLFKYVGIVILGCSDASFVFAMYVDFLLVCFRQRERGSFWQMGFLSVPVYYSHCKCKRESGLFIGLIRIVVGTRVHFGMCVYL